MEMIENGTLIGSINGTVFGGAALITGRKGLALRTNGIDQYVDFGYQGDTCLGYFTLCTSGWVTAFWVKFRNDTEGVVIDTGAFAKKGMRIEIQKERYFRIFFRGNNKKWFIRGRPTTEQGWVHVVVAWQLCSGVKLYIDGQMVGADATEKNKVEPVIQETRFVLGATYNYRSKFEGALDELRVWDTVMSDEEVLALYTLDAGLN